MFSKFSLSILVLSVSAYDSFDEHLNLQQVSHNKQHPFNLQALANVKCPSGCLAQQKEGTTQFVCVCPTSKAADQIANGACDPKIESCTGAVKEVNVKDYFTYHASASYTWGFLAFLFVAYSSVMGQPFTFSETDDLMNAWTYNAIWMMLTWGIQFLLWSQVKLFKSEGGFFDKMFLLWTKLSMVNVFIFYWLIDYLILAGILSNDVTAPDTNTTNYIELGVLFALQFISTMITLTFKPSVQFNYDLAVSSSKVVESTPVKQDDGTVIVVISKPAVLTNDQAISDYWGF